MRHIQYLVFSFLALVLIFGLLSPIKAQAASDHAEAIVGKKTYKFDWDYKRDTGDDDPVIFKNPKSHQDTVSAKSGSMIGAKIFYCCEDGGIRVSLTKDKVKVTHDTHNGFEADKIKFGKLYNAKLINDCNTSQQRGCQQDWQLPNIKKGTYSLLFQNLGSDEISEYYLTKIKIS